MTHLPGLLGHESVISLSTGHLCMSYFPWASSIRYPDGRVSGDVREKEEKKKLEWLTPIICCLTSWQFNAKGRTYQGKVLLSFLGDDRSLPTDQLFKPLNRKSVLFFLKEAAVCVSLVWKIFLSKCFLYEIPLGVFPIWRMFCVPLICGEGSSVLTICAVAQYNPTLLCSRCSWGRVCLRGAVKHGLWQPCCTHRDNMMIHGERGPFFVRRSLWFLLSFYDAVAGCWTNHWRLVDGPETLVVFLILQKEKPVWRWNSRV